MYTDRKTQETISRMWDNHINGLERIAESAKRVDDNIKEFNERQKRIEQKLAEFDALLDTI